MRVSEIFLSIQGEGRRAGEPSIFIRLQGCSAKYACYASGVICDTEFESGAEKTLDEIEQWISEHGNGCRWLIWTGGEPTDQLTPEIVAHFNRLGFKQAIETSGLHPVPDGLDWITLSPKVAEHVLAKNFPKGVAEIKYVRHAGQEIPQPSIEAQYYFVSPHSDGFTINTENVKHCIKLCLENPQWSLSVQQHKIWSVL